MADETLRFDIIGKDNASGAFSRVAASAKDMGGNMDVATRHALVLDEALKKQSTAARTSADATLAGARADKIYSDAMGVLSGRTIEAELALKREAAAAKKSGDAADAAAAKNRRLADSLKKVSDSALIAGSGKGTLLSLLPALIPLAAPVAGTVGLIGASFGAATIAAGGFGIAAKSVLASASSDSDKLLTVQTSRAAKLSQLQIQLGAATTGAQKKQIESQIATVKKASDLQAATIKAGWTQSYSDVVDSLTRIKATWKDTSRSVASPVLLPWLDAVNTGMGFLKPLIGPVAAEFQTWGQAIDRYFKSKAGSTEIHSMAVSFGQFASLQLADIVSFIRDVGSGVHALGHDLSADGVYFGSFGDYLARWGTEFAAWSKSKQARADVQGFLGYMHQNGTLVVGIVRDLGKVLPGIFAGASATGQLELKAVGGLLSLIAKLPKGWQGPLTEAAGALLLISKTGVISTGIKIVGVGKKVIDWLTGSSTAAIGAAGMQSAGDTMAAAAAAMQKAADTMVGADAAGGGAARAGGAAAGAGAGAGAAEGGTMAALGAASVPVAVGIIGGVAIAQLVNNDAASKASQAIASRVMKRNNLTPADIAAGKQTGGVVPGVPKSAIGSWQEYDHAVKGAAGDQVTWNKNAGLGRQAADTLSASVAAMRDRNKQLSVTFRNGLIPDLNTMHANTPKVRTDVQNLAGSILNTGNRSAATRGDRQKLITDLENAGVNARTATGFVNGLQKKIDAMHGKTVKVGVTETGVGHFTIAQVSSLSRPGGKLAGPLGSAAGRLVTGGVPGRDSVLLAAMPGEVVVPTHMVKGGAVDHLRGMIPGFASGGYVGSPAGMLGSFTSAQESAFQAHVTSAMKSAMTSALRKSMRQAAAAFASVGGPASFGVTRWAPLILQVLAMLGQSSANLGAVEHRMQQESGGNPFAINLTDSNAAAGDPSRGLMQTIGSTFARWRSWSLPNNIYNPEANIFAGLNYALHAYAGRSLSSVMLQPGGYDNGGWLPPGASIAVNKTGRPEQVIPPGGGELAGLLAEIADTLVSIDANTASGPHRTGRAVVDTLNGAARSSAYSSMYGSR
jgi:SLT domain-containing protein